MFLFFSRWMFQYENIQGYFSSSLSPLPLPHIPPRLCVNVIACWVVDDSSYSSLYLMVAFASNATKLARSTIQSEIAEWIIRPLHSSYIRCCSAVDAVCGAAVDFPKQKTKPFDKCPIRTHLRYMGIVLTFYWFVIGNPNQPWCSTKVQYIRFKCGCCCFVELVCAEAAHGYEPQWDRVRHWCTQFGQSFKSRSIVMTNISLVVVRPELVFFISQHTIIWLSMAMAISVGSLHNSLE